MNPKVSVVILLLSCLELDGSGEPALSNSRGYDQFELTVLHEKRLRSDHGWVRQISRVRVQAEKPHEFGAEFGLQTADGRSWWNFKCNVTLSDTEVREFERYLLFVSSPRPLLAEEDPTENLATVKIKWEETETGRKLGRGEIPPYRMQKVVERASFRLRDGVVDGLAMIWFKADSEGVLRHVGEPNGPITEF